MLLKGSTAVAAAGSMTPITGASDLALHQSLELIANTDKSVVANDTIGSTVSSTATNTNGSNGFSIADFLVPGLQTKTWDDWQSAVDDLSNQSDLAFGVQDFTSDLNAMAIQTGFESLLGNSAVWPQADLQGLPLDQAYDELVFDLSPSAFEQPTTVNTADLIAGPNAMSAVSPLDLALRANTYQDLALANLYGFTEPDQSTSDSQQESDDLEDEDGSDEDEDDDGAEQIAQLQDRQFQEDLNAAMAMSLAEANAATLPATDLASTAITSQRALSPADEPVTVVARPMLVREDSNKRRMEEQLAIRISNDLGPEHMAGLFRILKGTASDEEEDDDEEMEVDLSSLDETKLVELYQYVESCCIQTMGTILAAHQDRERAAAEKARLAREEEDRKAAAAAAAAAAYQEAMMRRTPELSYSQTSSSSNSPSPTHSPSKGRRSATKRSSPSTSTSEFVYTYEEEEDSWGPSSIHCKRKRVTNQGAGVGGGGTGKGRRITNKVSSSSSSPSLVTAAAPTMEETVVVMSIEDEEDDEEIDVVGI
ncbi:hypothetical protein BGW42_005032 [Actinomortierella wolfii]|nr:hypothetical protein BGW42_005032 [Actinomortierella wolfii]